MKRLSAGEGLLQILLINNAIGLLLSSIAVTLVWQTPTTAQWLILAGVGFSMATAQTFFINAVKRADTSFVAPFSFFTLVFAAGFDAAIYAKWPDGITILGAGIILAGAGMLAWRQGQIKQA
ncbi:DMT family transporter [Lentibacter algarum]|uniref:DMT family transporter n=1 Tax=Lentibacter algarum TaxID=576131 RepID=UPI002090FFAA|nr:DMT family transporter [Lentibacter algarum]